MKVTPMLPDYSHIMKQLNLPSVEQAESFTRACGFVYVFNEEKQRNIRAPRNSYEEWSESFKKWRLAGPLVEHDLLRGS